MKSRIFLSTLLLYLILIVSDGFSQENKSSTSNKNPLSHFDSLIGGEWHQKGGYQVFEWGVGKKSVRAENYFIVDGKPQKVSEGVWFWHPGEQQIKGYFTATNMPVEFFDYTTRFTEAGLESDLSAYDANGNTTQFLEKWEFIEQNRVEWTLFAVHSEGKTELMGGVMNRRSKKSQSTQLSNKMDQRLSLITLGVENLQEMTKFYSRIFGWEPSRDSSEHITFYQLNGFLLSLYERENLAKDAGVDPAGSGFKSFTLSYNLDSEDAVDELFDVFQSRNVKIVKPPQKAFWGGYSGYISDPEGNLWEIAYNPNMVFDGHGNVIE